MTSISAPVALQLCPMSDTLEAELAARLPVVRWFELAADAQAEWLAAQAADVTIAITGGHIGCDNALIAALPSLKLIAINGVGFDKVDLPFAQGRGVGVTTTPGVLTDDVADLAVGLLISLLRDLPAADAFVRAGRWPTEGMPLGRKVSGRRFGIVGLGNIGAAIADRLRPFGEVAYTGTGEKPVPYRYHADPISLARDSDVLVVACAANDATRNLIDGAVIEALGADGFLVNVARGSVIDEDALVAAVENGSIAGAALDVFVNEPHVPAALIASSRTVLAPHIASATVETRQAMADLVLANVDACLAGQPLPTALAPR